MMDGQSATAPDAPSLDRPSFSTRHQATETKSTDTVCVLLSRSRGRTWGRHVPERLDSDLRPASVQQSCRAERGRGAAAVGCHLYHEVRRLATMLRPVNWPARHLDATMPAADLITGRLARFSSVSGQLRGGGSTVIRSVHGRSPKKKKKRV